MGYVLGMRGRYTMLCEQCKKKINKVLEVRWINPRNWGYTWKQFESIEDLMKWVESDKYPGTVLLKVVDCKKNTKR